MLSEDELINAYEIDNPTDDHAIGCRSLAQEVARKIKEELERTAIWHNKVLHYNPDAWQAFWDKFLGS